MNTLSKEIALAQQRISTTLLNARLSEGKQYYASDQWLVAWYTTAVFTRSIANQLTNKAFLLSKEFPFNGTV